MPQIVILGAGVTGLQTALTLLRTPTISSRYLIRVIASHIPGDEPSAEYTSPAAGAHWRPHSSLSPSDAEQREWDERTYSFWRELLASKEKEGLTKEDVEKRVGLAIRESRNYWGAETSETEGGDGSGLWWKQTVEGFEVLRSKGPNGEAVNIGNDGGEKVPQSAVFGTRYQTVCINVPRYLIYLLEEVRAAGGKVIRAKIDTSAGLPGVIRDVKKKVVELDKTEEVVGLVNATGLMARHFVEASEAAKLYPVRGQTVIVKGEAKMARTFSSYDGPDSIAYVLPRIGSGTTVLGGSKQVGNWDVTEDKALTAKILEAIKIHGLAEELRTKHENGNRDFDIISVGAGLRPSREGGPRVEVEGRGRKIDNVWVVHAYGHAGAGYQNSVGSSEKVARLIGDLLRGGIVQFTSKM